MDILFSGYDCRTAKLIKLKLTVTGIIIQSSKFEG